MLRSNMLYITKRVQFSASHRLFNPLFTDEQNEEIYDKCNNLNGHGHNYVLEVTVSGMPDPQTGYVIDLKKLKAIIEVDIIAKVDHKYLNFDVDFLKGIIPTVENLAIAFWDKLNNKFPQGKLFKIKLHETESSWVEYLG
jgi:6-pyruvoyltetrahydropterin/6-carboxytetrahydropterin synthase